MTGHQGRSKSSLTGTLLWSTMHGNFCGYKSLRYAHYSERPPQRRPNQTTTLTLTQPYFHKSNENCTRYETNAVVSCTSRGKNRVSLKPQCRFQPNFAGR